MEVNFDLNLCMLEKVPMLFGGKEMADIFKQKNLDGVSNCVEIANAANAFVRVFHQLSFIRTVD